MRTRKSISSTVTKMLRPGAVATVLTATTGLTNADISPAAADTQIFTFAGVADWDRDGSPDVIARDGAGGLYLCPGHGTAGERTLRHF